jgi:hypothetical protein
MTLMGASYTTDVVGLRTLSPLRPWYVVNHFGIEIALLSNRLTAKATGQPPASSELMGNALCCRRAWEVAGLLSAVKERIRSTEVGISRSWESLL